MPKGFTSIIILLGIALVVLIGGIVIYQKVLTPKTQPTPTSTTTPTPSSTSQPSPTPDPTANWKSYKNSVLGFSIRYPSNWFVDEHGEAKSTYIHLTSYNQNTVTATEGLPTTEMKVQIQLETKESTLPFGAWIPKNDSYGNPVLKQETIEINGIQGVKQQLNKVGFRIFLPKNAEVVIAIDVGPEQSIYQTIFNQILSTFKFLN